jgi:hypothetical protein
MSFEELEKHIKIANWIKEFRDDRLTHISESDSAAAENQGRIMMHLIPFNSLDPMKSVILSSAQSILRKFEFLPAKHNSDGIGCDFDYDSYLQLFRNGAIEWTSHFSNGEISGLKLENDLISDLGKSLMVERSLGLELPIFVMISLLDAKDHRIFQDGMSFHDGSGSAITTNRLTLNPIIIDNWDSEIATILRPALDAIWQTAGKTGSPYYNENGNRRAME